MFNFSNPSLSLYQSLCFGAQVVWLAECWVAMLQSAGMFLTAAEDEQRMQIGQLMLRTCVKLARWALDNNKKLFRCRPKVHLLTHMCEDQRPSRLNPCHCSCWMDEDFIKRSMNLKKKVHRRTATQRTLQRYTLALGTKLREAQKKYL